MPGFPFSRQGDPPPPGRPPGDMPPDLPGASLAQALGNVHNRLRTTAAQSRLEHFKGLEICRIV
jgi:hypothetical protein